MAPFASDDFNLGGSGTDIVGQNPVVGGTWTDGSPSGSPSPVYASNRARQEDAPTSFTYVATSPPPGADYYVQADVIPQSGGSGGVAGVCGRKNASAISGIDCYWADYYDHATAGSRQWRLVKYVAGTATVLGTYTENIGTTSKTLKLEMIGTAIKLYVDGVQRVSVTDSDVVAAGRAGIVFGAASSPTTNAVFLDNFVADGVHQSVTVGTASETDSGEALVSASDQSISAGTASETDSALPTDPLYGSGAFLLDTFSGVDGALLTAHTSESGHTWAAHPNWAASATVISNNRLMRTNTTDQVVLSSVTPPSADYAATVQMRAMDAASVSSLAKGVLIRGDATASTFYWADYYDAATPIIRLFKFVAGVPTSLGTYAVTFAADSEHHLTLEAVGTAIKVYLDGVAVITATDSAISAAGRIGVTLINSASADTSSTHVHIASINALSAGANQSVTVGTASETDSGVGLGYDQDITVGTASETDSALQVPYDVTVAVGTAAEADEAFAVATFSATNVGGQGGLAWLFTGIVTPLTVTVGTASETDSAFSVTTPGDQTITVGTASETDSGITVVVPGTQTVTVGTALETDSALVIYPPGSIIVRPEFLPAGTAVGAYRRWEWKGSELARLGAGPGAAVKESVVGAELTVLFTGLDAGEWVLYAPTFPNRRLFFMVGQD